MKLSVRFTESGPDQDVRVSSRLWFGILVLLFVGVGATVFVGSYVVRNMVQTGQESLDNRTWVFAQLEVDYFRFETALHDAINADQLSPGVMRPLRHAFDIYYSRVETVNASNSLFDAGDPSGLALQSGIARTMRHRDALAGLIDQIEIPTREELVDILALSKEVLPTLREVTTGALMQLTRRYSETRQKEEMAVTQFIALSSVQALVLFAIAILAIRLASKLRIRATTMKRIGDSFKNIVEASLDGVVLLSSKGKILSYNTAAATIFDCHDTGVVGQSLADIALPRLRHRAFKSDPTAFMNSALGVFAKRSRLRTQLKTCRGRMFNAEVALAQHEDTFGRSIIIAFVRDLEDIVAHENDLKQARDKALQSTAAKGRFLNMMSHEMKTPLHGVIASLDLLQGDDLSPDDHENLQIARDSAAAALAQVEDVLAISSNEAGTPDTTPLKPFDPVEVAKLIVGQARLKARNKDVTVAYTITEDGGDSCILGREEAFRRAVANLVDNAVKFTESGTVKVHLVYGPENASGRRLTVKVSDTGPGIAPDVQDRAFEDFQTVSEGSALRHAGSGLGLGIARRAVMRMGGILHLDSRKNEGSHFSFDIPAPPVPKPHLTRIEPQVGEHAPPLHRTEAFTRALVVDDNAANRILMQKMLERLGYSVQCAENGEHAVELADAWRFTLILMDIQMPGLDGFETAMAIRAGSSSLDAVILGVTANLASQDAERFKVSGMQEMLAKPLTIGQLSEKVSHHIDGTKDGTWSGLSGVEAIEASDQFVISATSGNLSFISESMECAEFEGWLHACFDEIRRALDAAARDEPDCLQAIHKAAGTAAFIGLPGLQAALNQMEVASTQTDTGLFTSALFEASEIFRKIRVDLSGNNDADNRRNSLLNV